MKKYPVGIQSFESLFVALLCLYTAYRVGIPDYELH